jgi:hypothetical protein
MSAEQRLLHRIVEWGAHEPAVVAIGLAGSHARGTATQDSDIDLVVLVKDVTEWLHRDDWMAVFGTVEDVRDEEWGAVTSRRVRYRDGTEVEFGFTTRQWATTPLDAGTARVINDGFKILFDPSGVLEQAVTFAAARRTE